MSTAPTATEQLPKKRVKCDVRTSRWCRVMEERVAPEANQRRTGFVQFVTTNFRTDEDRTIGLMYRRGPRDNGVMLNVCPFCGTRIDAVLKSLQKNKTKAGKR